MGEDYPRTLMDLEKRFSGEEACREYLFVLRWPEGFVCPRCAGRSAWPMSRGLWLCGGCRWQVSVTSGTIFQDRKLPLTTWFRALGYVTSPKNGVSALGLQRVLGMGSYKTAWALLHKLRRSRTLPRRSARLTVRPGRDRLTGSVEVDETHWGADEKPVKRLGGWGLGLTFCRLATERQGGTIRAISPYVDGEGAAFEVVLPQ